MDLKKYFEEFQENGFVKIENFLTPDEVEIMRQGMNDAIEEMTDDIHVHSAYHDNSKETEEYYISSSDKVSYFFEEGALDSEGNLLVEKSKALNKIAYALHWWNPKFKQITFGQKMKDLLRAFEYKDPVVCQSMLIFKHPEIGEIFPPHQDSTFLYTEPPSAIGLWLPIQKATVEKGCLRFLPGSHKHGIYRRYVRNPGKTPFMVLKGEIPEFDDDKYVPVPANPGDAVLIHGSVIHRSGRNQTDESRIVYTFHSVESGNPWSPENWVQPSETLPFPSIFKN